MLFDDSRIVSLLKEMIVYERDKVLSSVNTKFSSLHIEEYSDVLVQD